MRRLALTPSAGAAVAVMVRLPRSSRARKENAMRRRGVIAALGALLGVLGVLMTASHWPPTITNLSTRPTPPANPH